MQQQQIITNWDWDCNKARKFKIDQDCNKARKLQIDQDCNKARKLQIDQDYNKARKLQINQDGKNTRKLQIDRDCNNTRKLQINQDCNKAKKIKRWPNLKHKEGHDSTVFTMTIWWKMQTRFCVESVHEKLYVWSMCHFPRPLAPVSHYTTPTTLLPCPCFVS